MGVSCVVYCEGDKEEIEYIGDIKVIHQKSLKSPYLCKILLSLRSTVRSLWNECDASIYHYNAWPPAMFSWLPRLFGKKTVLQGHGHEWKRTKYSLFQQKMMWLGEALTAYMSTSLTMVSQEQTDYFKKNYRRTCVTIPAAINLPDKDKYISTAFLEKYNLSVNRYFLYLGRLVKDKNPDVLIKAYNEINIKTLQDIKLVIAGDNKASPAYIEELYTLSKNNPNVIFTGAVYGEDKECLLKHCFAYCLPSSLEGLPISLLEAMSYKKLCIASNIPACKEALGNSGIWVEPESVESLSKSLVDVYEHFDNYKYLRIQNYERVCESFIWDKVAKSYLFYIQHL